MSESGGNVPHRPDDGRPKTFGRRAYLHRKARDVLNEASQGIFRKAPDYVDDPEDPTVDELLEYIRRDYDPGADSIQSITDYLAQGLTYQEAFLLYFWDHVDMDLDSMYYVCEAPVGGQGTRIDTGGHHQDRTNAKRQFEAVLTSACRKLGRDEPEFDGGDGG